MSQERRIHPIFTFDKLHAFRIDVYDVFIGKLFSEHLKDRDDLRAVMPKLDRDTLIRRLKDPTTSVRSEPRLLDAVRRNWFILSGDELPV